MMSRGYVVLGELTWRSSRLPSQLLMSMMVMTVMMFSGTSAVFPNVQLEPADGFAVGKPTIMNITCQYSTKDFKSFILLQNGTTVVKMVRAKASRDFVAEIKKKDFDCMIPRPDQNSGVVNCLKRNLNCKDATSYRCSLSDKDVSASMVLKVKSSLHSLEHVHNHAAAMKHADVFNCTARAAVPTASEVVFHWKVMHGFQMTSEKWDKVNVWGSDKCYANVTSSYHHHLGHDHSINPTVISCTVFQETRAIVVNQPRVGSAYRHHRMKSSLHSLEHVHNHDAAMKHVDVFNCTAHVALPSQNEVVFHWKVMHGFQMTSEKWDKVNVWGSDTCYANVTSSYHHHLGHDHSANPTTIACTVFQETRTKVVSQPHMGFPSAASGMLYTKWILVVNLILLFLVAAISR
ncbi:Hypothetical predicted protein [Octopus vulgaris]|uniref:Uncharacterized protein n=1 Tax=Octopus vulgaris TaxID=6645 RepID=A0AA36BMQ0_OCTVU|nr:Hypothetical predicted protein [Octopus vulgaris]